MAVKVTTAIVVTDTDIARISSTRVPYVVVILADYRNYSNWSYTVDRHWEYIGCTVCRLIMSSDTATAGTSTSGRGRGARRGRASPTHEQNEAKSVPKSVTSKTNTTSLKR